MNEVWQQAWRDGQVMGLTMKQTDDEFPWIYYRHDDTTTLRHLRSAYKGIKRAKLIGLGLDLIMDEHNGYHHSRNDGLYT
jgi:hypothetical protein